MVIKNKIDSIRKNVGYRLRSLKIANKNIQNISFFIRGRAIIGFYIITFGLLASGIVNALLEGSAVNASLPIIPGYVLQSNAEIILWGSYIFAGLFGLQLINRGTKQAVKGRSTTGFIVLGLVLLLIGLLIGFFVYAVKGS